MKVEKLSPAEARRIALAAQGFGGRARKRSLPHDG